MKREREGTTLSTEDIGERVIALLLVVMAVSVFLLWTLNSFTTAGQDAFAVYLAIDFVAFAMTSYIYRALNAGEGISKVLIVCGCLFIAILFLASLSL